MMFSDFNSAFQDEPLYYGDVPEALQNAIDEDLPEGLTYKEVDEDFFAVMASTGETNISFRVELPEKARKFLKEKSIISSEEIAEYLYNSQTIAKVVGDNNNCISLNGNKIPMDKIGKYPFSNIEIIDACMFVVPHKMEEKFELELGNGHIKKKLVMERHANDSITERKYVSDDSSCFKFTFYIDSKNVKNIRFAFDIQSEKATSSLDIYESYQIMNSICDNNAYINDEHVKMNSTPKIEKVPLKVIRFWEKVLKLEEYLKRKFIVNKGVREIDVQNINRLYRCLIQKKPFRVDSNAFYLRGHDLSEAFIKGLDRNPGYDIEFSEKKYLTALGITIEIIVLAGIYNAKVNKEDSVFDYENNNFELKLISANDQQIYESIRYFLPNEVEFDIDGEEIAGHPELLKDATVIDSEDLNI